MHHIVYENSVGFVLEVKGGKFLGIVIHPKQSRVFNSEDQAEIWLDEIEENIEKKEEKCSKTYS